MSAVGYTEKEEESNLLAVKGDIEKWRRW